MFKSYSDSLTKLKEAIPSNYNNKDELIRIINHCINDMAYKPPELLSNYFTRYCNLIIPLLPKDRINNQWVEEPWNNIHKVARDNIKYYKENTS